MLGTGYVGLVSGVCLAEKGHHVCCVDIDPDKVEKTNRGVPVIHERGLEGLLKKNIGKRFTATSDLRKAVLDSDLSMIAVGTPFKGDEIDLGYIREVSKQIGAALREKSTYHVVVVKSTVVPGTTQEVVLPVIEEFSGKTAGAAFGIGMNPEFLREGVAVEDFMSPDRIVLGGIDARTLDVLEELYQVFEGVDKIRTTPKTAEMIKYTSNALLATMISFSNEIGNLCTGLGDIDVVDVMRAVHLDKRLCPILPDGRRIVPQFTTYIEAGCGFGGSCFPKDVKALIAHGKKAQQPMALLQSVIQVNEQQPRQIIEILNKQFRSLKGIRLAILGLAFKPGTDDMRESPAIPIVNELAAAGASMRAFDPVARTEAEKILGTRQITYCEQLSDALDGADAVVLLTRWDEFAKLPELLADREPQPLVVDGRRMIDKKKLRRYTGIGI
ncbi:MAG: UDP-glucose/GDP-mannose dehydrogenase family protein [Desulfobacterales bacterium]|nr:UDP-glucose/GDP-mannose dehydrogenase family protein [Desulfobacterales bacterium]